MTVTTPNVRNVRTRLIRCLFEARYRKKKPKRKALGRKLFVIWFLTYLIILAGLPWIIFSVGPFGPASHPHAHPWVIIAVCGIAAWVLYLMLQIVLSQRFWRREVFLFGGPEKSAKTRQQLSAFNAGLIVVSFIALIGSFAVLFLQLTHDFQKCFGSALSHPSAIYFSITTLTTTGFGDLHPMSGGCQLVVSGQMLIGLAVLAIVFAGLIARIIWFNLPTRES
jgi:hypothetical protein